jgi:S-adenosylmethionine synthetase
LAVLKEENMKRLFTSESVTEGHPDKLCDYISDSILDSYLAKDKNARVACETVAGKGEIFITGEITSTANVDIEQVVRDTIKEVGYADSEYDIDYRTCKIYINLSKQSPDIALGVDKSLEDKEGKDVESEGAGDQGLMFGYACDETEELMPLPISLAHKLSKRLTEVRREKIIDYLRPDGKTQVTVEYDGDKPVRIDTIVVSTQHLPDVDMNVLKKDIIEKVIKPIVPANLLDENTKYFINPTGRFVIGGPLGDSGLTGRKIIVDTYGGAARHGGGAFSGKDPTKVDRSASYMARHIAKNIVANGYAKKCEIQIAYSIGVAKPVSIYVNTYGTNTIPEEKIIEKIDKTFDLTPRAIINYLDLQRPIYRQTTNYGHFGKKDLPWEKIINF